MAYTEIQLQLIKSGKELLYTLFSQVRTNFISHETRLTAIEAQGKRIPAGVVLRRGFDDAPAGYLLCDGASYVRGDYPELFAVIGTKYSAVDDGLNFNVPDLRGRIPIGVGPGYAMGEEHGAETETLSTPELATHTHAVTDPGHTHVHGSATGASGPVSISFSNPTNDTGTGQTGAPTAAATAVVSFASTGGGGAHNNVQPFQVCAFMVKT